MFLVDNQLLITVYYADTRINIIAYRCLFNPRPTNKNNHVRERAMSQLTTIKHTLLLLEQ